MRSLIILCCLTLSATMAFAQQNYDASLISKELLPYASAVVRNEEVSVEVKDLDNAVYHVKKAVTVLNKNGDEHARIIIYYDKDISVKSVKGVVYNQFGKQIGKFSESDFDDVSVGGESSLFDSQRVKHFLPAINDYPYTVAYEYEKKFKGTLYFYDWTPNDNFGVAVEKSSYSFTCKPDFKIKYKEINLPEKGQISTNAQGMTAYVWKTSNLKALKYEPFSPYLKNYVSCVQIAPEKFSYYGAAGSFTNWNELGKWINDKLVANRQELTYQTIERMKEITKDITDPKLKAKKIYEYMQAKTHYISVQVGIGGFQPFLASDVDNQNYGDCKALVNYTQALLKAVNIDSYYCIVKSGRDYNISLQNDFASMNQADHIILCVPFKNDTTWADCTSQTIPFGYLGGFTDNRTVLALTPQGGKLIRTPKYTAAENLESRKATFNISAAGELSGIMTTTYKGVNYEDCNELLESAKTEQYKLEQNRYPINNMNIESLDIQQDKSFDPATRETIKLQARDYASFNDGKIYFLLNPVNREQFVPKQLRTRLNDVYITRGSTNEDEVTYTLPSGYHLEKRPLQVSITKPFGNFSVSMELKGDQLIYKRKLQLIDGTYSKDTYQDLVNFYQSVVDTDEYNVVLIKSN